MLKNNLFAGETNSIKDDEREGFKSNLRSIAYTSLKFYNRKKKKLENISQEEHSALRELASLDNVVIQKADKGNVIVLLNKTDYVRKMEDILSDTAKFRPKVFDRVNGDLRDILEKEEEVKGFLTGLNDKGVISDMDFAKMVPCGSSPGIMYGLCKVHKDIPAGENCPPFEYKLPNKQ